MSRDRLQALRAQQAAQRSASVRRPEYEDTPYENDQQSYGPYVWLEEAWHAFADVWSIPKERSLR